MKLTLRVFALSIVILGAVAATVSPRNHRPLPSRQSATQNFPVPQCVPGLPTCPKAPQSQ